MCKISYRGVAIGGSGNGCSVTAFTETPNTRHCVCHGSFNPAFTTLSHANEKTVYTGILMNQFSI